MIGIRLLFLSSYHFNYVKLYALLEFMKKKLYIEYGFIENFSFYCYQIWNKIFNFLNWKLCRNKLYHKNSSDSEFICVYKVYNFSLFKDYPAVLFYTEY